MTDRLAERPVGGRAARTVLMLAAAAGLLAAPDAAASQASGEGDSVEEAWLGVGLRQSVRCETRIERQPDGTAERSDASGCTRSFVAEAVVDGAPADRAGVEPGDTVVAVNGRALSRASGREEFGGLETGRPAQLLVARPGEGRLSVRVTPEPRPPRVAPEDVSTAAPSRPPVPRGAATVPGAGGERAGVPSSARLEAIRDSVLAQARRHIRALRERQREALRRARTEAASSALRPGELGEEESRRVAEALRDAEWIRAAGAEFRPLTAALSDYFPGAERGLLIMDVVAGTPADELGLRPGDVVVEAGGREIAEPGDLRGALDEYPSRDSLVVRWIRKGEASSGVLRRP